MVKQIFSFDGRIRRKQYWISNAMYISCLFLLGVLFPYMGELSFILIATYLLLVWAMIAQGAKRCHDPGKSGWWQLIPFYGIWMCFADGEAYSNRYGHDPKGRGMLNDFLEPLPLTQQD